MKRRFLDTTVVYDVHGKMYLQAELYGTGDPAETIEMRVLEPGQVALGDGCRGQRAGGSWQTAETIEEPFVLEERHIKQSCAQRRRRRQTEVLLNPAVAGRPASSTEMIVINSPADTLDDADSGALRGRSTHTLDGMPLRNDK